MEVEPLPMLLFCPSCHAQHEDLGEWETVPHLTHRCQFCNTLWRPSVVPTVGVPTLHNMIPGIVVPLAVFKKLPHYSLTLPTSPKPGFQWRKQFPSYGEARTAKHHYLGTVITGPEGAGYNTIIWRQLYVAEWLLIDALLA